MGHKRAKEWIMVENPPTNFMKHIWKKKGWDTWKSIKPRRTFINSDGMPQNIDGLSSLQSY
jgi:hypothetical protein